ncbi:hypothetical protein R6Q57_018141 [Mikania cordata]
MDPKFAGGLPDMDQMPETPTRGTHHRRTQSDTSFRFTDEGIILDDVVADFNLDSIDLPMLTQDSLSKQPVGFGTHLRSLSVGSNFFDELGLSSAAETEKPSSGAYRRSHKHSSSMDGSAATSFEEESVLMMLDNSKKAVAPEKLAELSLIDPKRAKRILANRQSAARSKERKIKYTSELEKKVQTLQTEATTLSAQVTKLERETGGLTSENKELKLRLEAMEQHALLRDALNEALREEVNRLKLETGQLPPLNGVYYNTAPLPPQHHLPLHQFGNSNSQQTQKAQVPELVTVNQLKPSFMDFK